jgi:hypothetical protein
VLFAFAATAGAACTSTQPETTGEAAQASAIASIHNAQNGQCVDVFGFGTSDLTRVGTYDCTGGTNQQWLINTNGTIENPTSGKCLDANFTGGAAITPNGTIVQIYACWGGANQSWEYDGQGQIRLAGTNKCLDMPNGAPKNQFNDLLIYDCWGGPNQRWTVY